MREDTTSYYQDKTTTNGLHEEGCEKMANVGSMLAPEVVQHGVEGQPFLHLSSGIETSMANRRTCEAL